MNAIDPTESVTEPAAVPPVDPVQTERPAPQQETAIESALNAVVADLLNDVPAAMRDLVPNLPPAEKAIWIRQAVRKGLFASPPASSPDARRPVARPAEDLNALSPVAKMAMGYK